MSQIKGIAPLKIHLTPELRQMDRYLEHNILSISGLIVFTAAQLQKRGPMRATLARIDDYAIEAVGLSQQPKPSSRHFARIDLHLVDHNKIDDEAEELPWWALVAWHLTRSKMSPHDEFFDAPLPEPFQTEAIERWKAQQRPQKTQGHDREPTAAETLSLLGCSPLLLKRAAQGIPQEHSARENKHLLRALENRMRYVSSRLRQRQSAALAT